MPDSDAARQRTREALALCESLGFARSGVCAAAPSGRDSELRDWLDAGKHGSMAYLARNVEARLDPRRLLPGCRSIIMVADRYWRTDEAEWATRAHGGAGVSPARRGATTGGTPGPPIRPIAPMRTGRIARYARGRDYHVSIKKRLHKLCDALRERFPEARCRAFTDTAPVLEREHAARAGLGWIGKHTLLIHPDHGSYLLLGGVLTTLELAVPEEQRAVADHCGSCTRCIDACPTDAITPYSVDARRCVSCLTIEQREAIDPEFDEGIGAWIFGCDICQEVCPHNRPRAAPAATPHPDYAPRRDGFDLLKVLGWDEADRRAAFTGSALKRARLDMMKRNALIAAGNLLARQRDDALLARVREIADDEGENAMVREAAQRALKRLDGEDQAC